MSDPVTRAQVEDISKITCMEYFDTYLQRLKPLQDKQMQKTIDEKIRRHDDDDEAHGKVEMKVTRFVWLIVGASTVGGVGVSGALKLFLGM